jgi:soluble lytic murein transglycosylase-like protein
MKRIHPKVRALCDRVRQPTTVQILAGLLLTAPAGLMTIRDAKIAEATTEPIKLTAVEAVVPAPTPATRTNAQATLYANEYKISTTLAKDIHKAASEAGISPKVAFGLVRAESSFRTAAVSPVGAIGLTQLMPATAKWLEPGISRQQLKNPETNLRIGFKYLKQLIHKYDGNEELALLAFNRGPGTVDKVLKRGGNPDNGYADKVLTGKSKKHVALMNKKFGRKRS